MTKQIPDVGKGERSVIVARFPNGQWSYGGVESDPVYEGAELYRVWYSSHLGGLYGRTIQQSQTQGPGLPQSANQESTRGVMTNQYRISYGSTYAGGESEEEVVEASSLEAANDMAMNKAAQMCCFWSAESISDGAIVDEEVKEAESTARSMLRTIATHRGVSGAKDFNEAFHKFCMAYARGEHEQTN
jgi:hypothetical protein